MSHIVERLRDVNPGLRSLIIKMVSINPDTRPTANELLSHPWVLGEEYLPEDFDEKGESNYLMVAPVYMNPNLGMDSVLMRTVMNYHDPKSIASNASMYL